MKKKIYLVIYVLITLSSLSFFSCNDNKADKETKKINEFILNCFEDVYLWNDKLPKVNTNNEPDPFALFNKLKYKEDRWSMLIEDVKGFNESLAGSELSFGYNLIFYYISENSNEVIAVVRYVHPSTPAEMNGLKRGDIILQINGENLTDLNYTDLYNASAIKIGLGEFQNGEIILTERTVQLNATKMYLEPIITHKIIEKNGHKIGYIHYTDYTLKSHEKLTEVFTYFKNHNVSDVVLDLRYNGGGYAITSQYLCSLLVPEHVLNSKKTYLKEVWNKRYSDYYISRNKSMTKIYDWKYGYTGDNGNEIIDEVKVNMDLSRVFILTGRNTASASEATIVGLMPYMEVIRIGETTSGKYCGGVVLSPEDYKMNDKNIQNWGAYVMVYRYANSDDYPDHSNGLEPNIYIKEDLLAYPIALGDENEPLFATAISQITGTPLESPLRLNSTGKYRKADNLNYNNERMINSDYEPAY